MVLADGGVALPAAGPFSCPSVVGVGWQVLPAGPLLGWESQLLALLSAGGDCWSARDCWSACLGCGGVVGLGGHPCCGGWGELVN